PHDTGSNVNLMNLVAGGNPPNLFMESNPGVYRDLTKAGLGRPLTDFFKEHGYPDKYPDAVARSMVVDDQVMKVPTALHIDGMVYYNMDVAKKLGIDPTAWKSLDEMFADFDKVKAAGVIPLAGGGQQWQVG
ncbi:extracellular solute-binding protein, partial [Rhizobium leguminosarum]|nr:extracellular solute-binding protein [Rhizobium leguminosarum]